MSRAVEPMVSALRERILDGDLQPGERLVEAALTERHGAARHTVRAALRVLAAEGLVRVEPNKGARVRALDEATLTGLYDLRTAIEAEAARRLEEVPAEAHAALEVMRRSTRWSDIAEAHLDLHHALVRASGSARLTEAHRALQGEERLFLGALRSLWQRERMVDVHERLLGALGPEELRAHLTEGLVAVSAALRDTRTSSGRPPSRAPAPPRSAGTTRRARGGG